MGAARVGGTFICSNELSTLKHLPSLKLHTYPNPCTSMLYLKWNNGSAFNGTAILFDINGKETVKKTENKDGFIDVSTLPSGIYILKVFHNQNWYSQKVIKE